MTYFWRNDKLFSTLWRTFWHHDVFLASWQTFCQHNKLLTSWNTSWTSWRTFWCRDILLTLWPNFWRHDVPLTEVHAYTDDSSSRLGILWILVENLVSFDVCPIFTDVGPPLAYRTAQRCYNRGADIGPPLAQRWPTGDQLTQQQQSQFFPCI